MSLHVEPFLFMTVKTPTKFYIAFFYTKSLHVFCMFLFCTVLHLNVKSEASLCGIVLNLLLSCLSWLLFCLYLYQHCYAINRDPLKSEVIKVSGFAMKNDAFAVKFLHWADVSLRLSSHYQPGRL